VGQLILDQFRKTNLIIVVAQHLSSKLVSLGINNIKVIENTVDAERFYPAPKKMSLLRQLNVPENANVIAHISNFKSLKRPLDVVHSAKKVLEQNPDLIYLIVGDGLMRDETEDACRSNNLLAKFRFVGWLNYNDIPDYINLSDIVLMPSEAEARAFVYMETQACGRVLIASDIPAAKEVIADGKTGFLFAKGDIDDLTAKILLAASDAKLRAEIGHKSREQVLSHSIKNMVQDYEAACLEVVRKYDSSS
jgi:glycosyltransferase involved in cell wall biosynthesis